MEDARQLKYVLGESLPKEVIGDIEWLSALITHQIAVRLLKLGIKKNIVYSNDSILKVLNDVYFSNTISGLNYGLK